MNLNINVDTYPISILIQGMEVELITPTLLEALITSVKGYLCCSVCDCFLFLPRSRVQYAGRRRGLFSGGMKSHKLRRVGKILETSLQHR